MSEIKQFYNRIQFPGPYTEQSLGYHWPDIRNPYLKIIDSVLYNKQSVLDVGCGSGLITNLFSRRYPDSTFVAVDFADGIDFAKAFAKQNNRTNIKFVKKDFSVYTSKDQFDVVICQGVLHHMPNWEENINRLKELVKDGGTLVLGVYHPWGKLAKRYFNINYKNSILHEDQELNPFETSFTQHQVVTMCNGFTLLRSYPKNAITSLINYKNGGLITYVFEKTL